MSRATSFRGLVPLFAALIAAMPNAAPAQVAPGHGQAAAAPQGVRWQIDIEQARQIAKHTNRLVLIHFWKPSCGPCLELDQRVFSQPQFAAALESEYVPVKVNTDEYPEITRRYQIAILPTDVIITPEGNVVATSGCPADGREYAQLLTARATSYRRANAQFAQADRQSAAADPTRNTPASFAPMAQAQRETQVPSADPSNETIRPVRNYADAPPVTPAQNPYESHNNASARPEGYAQQGQYGAAPPTADSRYNTPPTSSSPTPTASANTPRNTSTTNKAALPYAEVAMAAGGHPPAAPPTPVLAPASPAPALTPPAIQTPATPTLCLDGLCPVTLTESQKWVPGNKQFGAVHRGRVYLFVSPEAQQRFLSSPDKYSPAVAGYDAVAWVEQGQLVAGNRQYGGFYNHTVYIFSSEASLRQFEVNPSRYAAYAEQALQATGTVRR